MLVFIMLNMTTFYVKKGCLVVKNRMCCPYMYAPHTRVHWDTFFRLLNMTHLTVNISKCIQDPQA